MHNGGRWIAQDGTEGDRRAAEGNGGVDEHDDVTDDDNAGVGVGVLVELLFERDFGVEADAEAAFFGLFLCVEQQVL